MYDLFNECPKTYFWVFLGTESLYGSCEKGKKSRYVSVRKQKGFVKRKYEKSMRDNSVCPNRFTTHQGLFFALTDK